jgi:hypothetical protein
MSMSVSTSPGRPPPARLKLFDVSPASLPRERWRLLTRLAGKIRRSGRVRRCGGGHRVRIRVWACAPNGIPEGLVEGLTVWILQVRCLGCGPLHSGTASGRMVDPPWTVRRTFRLAAVEAMLELRSGCRDRARRATVREVLSL